MLHTSAPAEHIHYYLNYHTISHLSLHYCLWKVFCLSKHIRMYKFTLFHIYMQSRDSPKLSCQLNLLDLIGYIYLKYPLRFEVNKLGQ